MAAAVMPSRANSMYVAAVPFGLGLFGFGLNQPWKNIVLYAGIFLALGWLVFWLWRAFCYLRSVEFYKQIRTIPNSMDVITRTKIYGKIDSSYSEKKLIALRNIAVIGGICAVLFFTCAVARWLGADIPRGIEGYVYGVGISGILFFLVGLWQLMTSPKQDAEFMNWWTPGLQKSRPLDIGVTFPDPSDPHFDVATYRYLAQKIRANWTK